MAKSQTAARPSPAQRRRAQRLLDTLRATYPDARCTLDGYEDPWRLLVGGILATQCTDARVNQTTPGLFARYPDVAAMAAADIPELEEMVRSCGMYRTKARNLRGAAALLLERHDGEVPAEQAALEALPGIGRKIANLILSDAYGVPRIVVDTHNGRISRLMGLTEATNPLHVERDLMALLPEDGWTEWGHLVVTHGREICIARRPDCERCPCRPDCRFGSGR